MDIAIIGSEATQGGWAATAVEGNRITWIQTPEEATASALLIDTLFDGTELRISQLLAHKGPVWVNDVAGRLPAGSSFVRVNGWNGFERSTGIEAAGADILRADAEAGAIALGKTIEWLPDTAGFVTPRVIAMIVNEAFHALSEGVSSRNEIDTAMKLGTNYPHGPFEWAGIIGLDNIAELLEAMAERNERYTPNELLLKEARL